MRQKFAKLSRGNLNISRRLEIKYDIDALLKRYHKSDFRSEANEKELETLLKKYGSELFDDLMKRLDKWEESEHEGLFWILSYLGNDELIGKLWYYIGKSKKTFKPRLVALSLLKEMGQDIVSEMHNLQSTALDITGLESIMSESIHFMLDAVQNAKGSDQIQNIFFQLEEIQEQSVGGEEFLQFLIDATFDRRDQRAADFLLAMSLILSAKNIRDKARANYQKLRFKGIEPLSPYIQVLTENRLHKIYFTSDAEEELYQLSLAWQRENDLVQVYTFLLDSERILDFFVTQNISRNRFEKEFCSEPIKSSADVKEISFESLVQMLNKYYHCLRSRENNLPGPLNRFSHILDDTLTQAANH